MLSILIPTYNADLTALLQELHSQINKDQLAASVWVCDDASTYKTMQAQNKNLSEQLGFNYLSNTENLGRTATRAKLAQVAPTKWLLFLDADVIPAHGDFLKQMISDISEELDVVFGGVSYADTPPPQAQLLRYIYGKKREARSASERSKNPHFIISQNLCITKSMFECCNTVTANGYGMDNLFSNNLKNHKARVKHTDNAVIHLGLESSEQFLEKSLQGIQTTVQLEAKGLIAPNLRPIQRLYNKLKKFGLTSLFLAVSNGFSTTIEKNLKGKRPSLLLFDIYRMNHLIKLKK